MRSDQQAQLRIFCATKWYRRRPRKPKARPASDRDRQLHLDVPGIRAPFVLPLPCIEVGGILVQVVADGRRPRVRCVEPEYDPSVWCRFPQHLRELGARYLVGKLDLVQRTPKEAPYYQPRGEIRRVPT